MLSKYFAATFSIPCKTVCFISDLMVFSSFIAIVLFTMLDKICVVRSSFSWTVEPISFTNCSSLLAVFCSEELREKLIKMVNYFLIILQFLTKSVANVHLNIHVIFRMVTITPSAYINVGAILFQHQSPRQLQLEEGRY